MAWHRFRAKPFPETKMAFGQLDPREQTSVKHNQTTIKKSFAVIRHFVISLYLNMPNINVHQLQAQCLAIYISLSKVYVTSEIM